MTPLVVDTSVASLIHNRDTRAQPYADLLQTNRPIISFQTIAEMRWGALNNNWGAKRKEELEQFLGGFLLVGYTDELSHCWAQMMYEAQRAGRRLEPGDAWIAATALLLNAPLITHDKDFSPEACPSLTIIRYAP